MANMQMLSRVSPVFIFVCLTSFLCACNNQKASEGQAAIERSVTDSIQSDQIRKVMTNISSLSRRIAILEGNTGESPASVSTEDNTYSPALTPFGRFPIKCTGITSYLDGYKVKLAIGNITTATFHGVKVKVTWTLPLPEQLQGEAQERFDARYQEWVDAPVHEKELEITQIISPARYTTVELSLTPAKASEVKTINVWLTFNQISLAN